MLRTIAPEPISKNGLFETETFGWTHTQLALEAFPRTRSGMEGLFCASILKLMHAVEIGGAFDPQIGRPTKELHTMCGLLLLGEYRNWNVEQTSNAWCFDASVQFALSLPRDKQNMSERTVDSDLQLLRDNEAAQDNSETVTVEIIREVRIAVKKQRLDSTSIFSNMVRFGRLKLQANFRTTPHAAKRPHPAVSCRPNVSRLCYSQFSRRQREKITNPTRSGRFRIYVFAFASCKGHDRFLPISARAVYSKRKGLFFVRYSAIE